MVMPLIALLFALDWKPYAVLASGQFGGDALSTYRFQHNGNGCVEGSHHLIGRPPATTTQEVLLSTGLKVGAVTGITYLLGLIHNDEHPKAAKFLRGLGKGLSYFAGSVGVGVAVYNYSHCGW